MQIESASCIHVGRRSNNEDSYCAVEPIGCFAVADGMGGYEGGEVASRVAIETLERFYRVARLVARLAAALPRGAVVPVAEPQRCGACAAMWYPTPARSSCRHCGASA